jgi:hypothetical protein
LEEKEAMGKKAKSTEVIAVEQEQGNCGDFDGLDDDGGVGEGVVGASLCQR